MRLTEKTERYSINRNFVGKYKKWNCNIYYCATNYTYGNPFWYFYCKNSIGNVFNSLWEELRYNSKEECHDACVKYIDEQEGK